jgi:Tol biopolymer transport system component
MAVLSLATGDWHVLGPGSQAQYLSSGYLVYHAPHLREGELEAVPFDLETATFRGKPASVLDGVFRAANGGAAFFAVAAQTGTLIFAPGGFARALVRVDRRGRRIPISDERLGFRFPRFSPDGRKVAVTIDPRPSQIWVYDLERGSRIPLATNSLTPLWTPDGQRIAFSARAAIDWRAADGSRPAEQLLAREHAANPTSWSSDGRFLIFQEDAPPTRYDIWVAPRGGRPQSLVSTPGNDVGGKFSPDGRWLAYYSNESGRNEVYVRPFPNVNEHKWTVSTAGGQAPVWSPDGRELFYMNGTAMMAVPIETRGTSLVAGKPQFLFDGPFDTTQDMNFDISPDGTRFVMVEADPDAKPTRFQIILNWTKELSQLVAGRGN